MKNATLLLNLIWILVDVEATPFFLINSPKARCVTVTLPRETKLRVDYEAPDIVLANANEPNVWITIHAKHPKPVSIHNAAHEFKQHVQSKFHGLHPPTATQERLRSKKGTLVYETQENGPVEVCLRAAMASTQNPMRFSWQMSKEVDLATHNSEDETDAERNLSHMELELKHLMASMHNIISEADFSKERETQFHLQTLSMHAASMWWPIVQLCVLILTGFTQANHVVRFLKSKRLI